MLRTAPALWLIANWLTVATTSGAPFSDIDVIEVVVSGVANRWHDYAIASPFKVSIVKISTEAEKVLRVRFEEERG